MQPYRSVPLSYVRKPRPRKVMPTKDKQAYSITFPSSDVQPLTESTQSWALQSLSSSSRKQFETNNEQQQKPAEPVVSNSSNHRQSPSSINNIKTSENNSINPRPTCSKVFIIIIIVGTIISVITLTTLGIDIYFLIRQTTSNNRNSSVSLRWMTEGITVAGTGDATLITANRLSFPTSIALDSSNTMYITDYLNNRVQQWTVNAIQGTTVAGQATGATGIGSNFLFHPIGVVVDENGNVYVSDAGHQQVQFWANGASTGTTIAGTVTGTAGSANNQLNTPSGLSRDPNTGTLYIADSNNNRIMEYTLGATTGTVVAGGNGQGISNTQLTYPMGVYYDAFSNSLFIANLFSHSIVRWIIGASSWTLVAGSSSNITGSTPTLLYLPLGITLDPMGNLYVADTGNHRIQVFMAGQSIGQTIVGLTTTCGQVSSLLCNPYWVTLDQQLNLYVVDTSNNRVQKFLRY